MKSEVKKGPVEPKVYITTVDKEELAFQNPKVTGEQLLKAAGFKHLQCHTLYQKLKGCDFKKVQLDDIINLADDEIEHFITKGPDVFNYTVDNEPETTEKNKLTPNQILERKGLEPANHYLIQILKGGEHIIYANSPDEPIVFDCRGMTFQSEKWLDIVDIEEFGKHCKPVPYSRIYRIKIDKNYHNWTKPNISVQELIDLEYPGNLKPVEVYKFLNSSPKPIKLKSGEIVNLREKCLVRFTIQPKEQEDGKSIDSSEEIEADLKIRKDFLLPEEDMIFLDSLDLLWEAIGNQPGSWLLIHDYPIPEGYNVQKAEIAISIVGTYPAAQIDMAYFFPPLVKNSKRVINNVFDQPLDQRNFQGWSRHRKIGEWRPGVDNVATHLCLVDNWLTNDLLR